MGTHGIVQITIKPEALNEMCERYVTFTRADDRVLLLEDDEELRCETGKPWYHIKTKHGEKIHHHYVCHTAVASVTYEDPTPKEKKQ